MDIIVTSLLPLGLAATLVPIQIVVTVFLLQSGNGVAKAIAFAAGVASIRILQGILFGYVIGGARAGDGDGRRSAIITATLLLVLGILLLITAYKTWRKEDDPDAPPPKWMTSISGLSIPKAFGLGMLLMLIAAKQ